MASKHGMARLGDVRTHAVVAEAHVVEGHVVLPDGLGRLAVVGQRLVVLADAVVEAPDLEGDVLPAERRGWRGGVWFFLGRCVIRDGKKKKRKGVRQQQAPSPFRSAFHSRDRYYIACKVKKPPAPCRGRGGSSSPTRGGCRGRGRCAASAPTSAPARHRGVGGGVGRLCVWRGIMV